MSIRRLLRGEIPQDDLQSVASEAVSRHGETLESVRLLEADNWLSTPVVVNDQFFLKIISAQNTIVHGLLTTGRNLGVFSSGSEGFFERFGTPIGMANHELESTKQMRELGVNVPDPIEAFEHEGYGIVMLEYLPEFRTLDELEAETVAELAPELFSFLATMHDAEIVHGDLRGENVLVTDEELYFIDATKVKREAIEDARAYDIACALAALEPLIGAGEAVAAASDHYSGEVLVTAQSFLDFVNMRPDHHFDAVGLKGELAKVVD